MNGLDAARWLRARRRLMSPRMRLVCCPYAGGAATVFHNWTDKLPSDVEVLGVQLPGRQDRFHEPALRRMDPLVEHVRAALAELPEAPTVLFGHSMGSFLAFEVARRLQAGGVPPIALVVGAARGPSVLSRDEPIHALAHAPFLQAIHDRYSTSWTILRNSELMSLALPPLRADLEVLETYRYDVGPPLTAPIRVLRGLRDTRVTAEDAAAWHDVTAGHVTVAEVDAGHLFVDSRPDWVIEQVKVALSSEH